MTIYIQVQGIHVAQSTIKKKYNTFMKLILKLLSGGTGLVSIVLGLLLAFSKSEGGFFPGLGLAIGEIVFGTGIAITFLLNVLYWYLYGAPTWLKVIVALQAIPAFCCIAALANYISNFALESRAGDQRSRVADTIRRDDLEQFMAAKKLCRKRCIESYSVNSELLDAVDYGAHQIAQHLILQEDGNANYVLTALAPTTTLSTCEGNYLGSLQILQLAVARNDAAMTRLLLPVSNNDARRSALWLAARLDRFELMQLLLQSGTPVNIRGEILDENKTLLSAAASGAALRVGQWLIEKQHMPVNAVQDGPDPYNAVAPVHELFQNANNRLTPLSPRFRPFLKMLLENGAHIDALLDSGKTLLQEVIHTGDKRSAQLLLDYGASRGKLSDSEKDILKKLLAGPDEETSPPDIGLRCVVVADSQGQPEAR